MRKIILISAVLLSACSKEWNCTITTEYAGQTIITQTTFHGTNAEKNDFENTLTPNQTVECN